MSDLQLALIVAGAIVVAGIWAYNRVQERKYHREAEERYGPGYQDVLMGETEAPAEAADPTPVDLRLGEETSGRVEPRLDLDVSPPPPPPPAVKPGRVETVSVDWDDVPPAEAAGAAPAEKPQRAAAPAPAADEEPARQAVHYLVEIRPVSPVPTTQVADLKAATSAVGKAVTIWGLDQAGSWAEVGLDGGPWSALKVGLQLADRRGPLSAVQLAEFRDVAESFAARWGAVVDCPSFEAAVERAVELDRFCADMDIQVGITLIVQDGRPIAATKVRALAESSGFRLTPEGVFRYVDDEGRDLFALANAEGGAFTPESIRNLYTHGVTLLLDVPRVANGLGVFDRMAQMARQMASQLHCDLVDDNRRPLDDAAIARIKAELQGVYARMNMAGLHPGGPTALRLFA